MSTSNARAAYEFLVGKGLPPHQAAGVLGNLIQESNVDPTASEPGGPGRGIAQWSVGGRWDSASDDSLFTFARRTSGKVWSLDTQLDFLWYELMRYPAYGLAELRAAGDVREATIAFQSKFERCGDCRTSQRVAFAESALLAYAGIRPGPGLGSFILLGGALAAVGYYGMRRKK